MNTHDCTAVGAGPAARLGLAQEVYAVVVAAPEEGTAAVSFVGRDRELARVTDLLDEARAGRGRLLLCTGEAGIGKTRLAEETATAAVARGAAVAWARSSGRDIAPPYGLWRLALRGPPGMRGQRGDKSGSDLWSLAFGGMAGHELGSGSELDRGQRFALFSAVRERLAQAAEPDGLLLVLDDVQWADEPSAAAARAPAAPAARRPDADPGHLPWPAPSGDRAGELIRMLHADANTERAALAGLPPVAVAALLASAGQAASAEQGQTVHVETGVPGPRAGPDARGAARGRSRHGAGDYRFSHALVRSAVVAQLSGGERGGRDRAPLPGAAALWVSAEGLSNHWTGCKPLLDPCIEHLW